MIEQGKPRAKIPPGTGVGGIGLADDEFHLDSVGLRMRIPAGAQAESVRIGDRTSVQVSPPDAKWIINIQTPLTSNEKATTAEAADRTIEALSAMVGVVDATGGEVRVADSQARLMQRVDDLQLGGGMATRFYISLPADNDPRGKTRLVKGYTIFKPSAKQFVVFELVAGEPDFGKARTAYETSVGTASFEAAGEIAQSRRTGISAGVALFAQLGEQDFIKAMGAPGSERWYRLYMPGANGAAGEADELGYRGVKFWKGERGEIDPKKPRTAWGPIEHQEGYLVQDRSRVLVNGMIADSVTLCFMTPDRNEEIWTATTAVKDKAGKSVATVTELGTRLKKDVTVVSTETGKPSKSTKPVIAGEGYISQFEKALLPRLLAGRRTPGDYAFYAWDTLSRSIAFRRDGVESQKIGNRGEKVWNITTTIRDDSKRQTTTVTDEGEVLGVTLDDGRTWEVIELSQLKSLWQQKGLPTDR